MIINNPKQVDAIKLGKELLLVGIEHNGMSPTPKTLTIALVDENYEDTAKAVYDAHDPNPDIYELRAIAIAEINAQCEYARMQYLTKGDAQGRVYDGKQAEIIRYSVDQQGSFPYAEQRATRHGVTVADIRTEWTQIAEQIEYMLVISEGIREATKEAISIANNSDDIDAIMTGLVWSE